jgi:hypothetical protein
MRKVLPTLLCCVAFSSTAQVKQLDDAELDDVTARNGQQLQFVLSGDQPYPPSAAGSVTDQLGEIDDDSTSTELGPKDASDALQTVSSNALLPLAMTLQGTAQVTIESTGDALSILGKGMGLSIQFSESNFDIQLDNQAGFLPSTTGSGTTRIEGMNIDKLDLMIVGQ